MGTDKILKNNLVVIIAVITILGAVFAVQNWALTETDAMIQNQAEKAELMFYPKESGFQLEGAIGELTVGQKNILSSLERIEKQLERR